MGKLSVVMLARNHKELTLAALAALVRAHFEGEVILVDQGSSDGVAQAAAEFLHDRVPYQVVRNLDNQRYSVAANRAASLAQGDVLLFLDNDTELQQGALCQMMTTLESEPQVAAVGPKLVTSTGQVQEAGLALPLWLVPFPIGVHARGDDVRYSCPRPAWALSTSALLVRRAAFETVGGFDEALDWGFESADLSFALRRKQWRMYYEPRAVCVHQGGATLAAEPLRNATEANRQRFLERWGESLMKGVVAYLDRLSLDGPRRFAIYGTGEAGRHLANTLELGGYEVVGFLGDNGVRLVDRYPAWNVAEAPADLDARILIGSPYVREAEDALAAAGRLGGAALPILYE